MLVKQIRKAERVSDRKKRAQSMHWPANGQPNIAGHRHAWVRETCLGPELCDDRSEAGVPVRTGAAPMAQQPAYSYQAPVAGQEYAYAPQVRSHPIHRSDLTARRGPRLKLMGLQEH